MADPTIEYIADNISDAVNEITTANGYTYSLVCIRPTAAQFRKPTLTNMRGWLVQESTDTKSAPLYSTRKDATFTLTIPVIISNDATGPRDTVCNNVAADIEKKLLIDVTRGAYALDTAIEKITFTDEENVLYVVADIRVDYMHKYGDPYSK